MYHYLTRAYVHKCTQVNFGRQVQQPEHDRSIPRTPLGMAMKPLRIPGFVILPEAMMSNFVALVVEDDAFQRECLADLLKSEGLEVVECANGEVSRNWCWLQPALNSGPS